MILLYCPEQERIFLQNPTVVRHRIWECLSKGGQTGAQIGVIAICIRSSGNAVARLFHQQDTLGNTLASFENLGNRGAIDGA